MAWIGNRPNIKCNLLLAHAAFSRKYLALAMVATLLFGASGCQQKSSEAALAIPERPIVRTEKAKVRSAEKLKLAPRLRKQIQESIERFYGTTSEPRLFEPAADTTASTDEKPAEEKADGDAGDAKIKLVAQLPAEHLKRGRAIYEKRCLTCHGATGDGEGPVAGYMQPRPRDYRLGAFKFTSTPFGAKPRRADLIRTVLRGAKGTSMPSFRWLDGEDLHAVVDYVVYLSQRGEVEQKLLELAEQLDPEDEEDNLVAEDIHGLVTRMASEWREAEHKLVVPLSSEPPYNDESIALGRAAFLKYDCNKCHGRDGRGRTQAAVGEDSWFGEPAYAADLTSGMLRGGRRSIDIYRRIYSGINGTQMPSFMTQFAQEPDTIWHLVHFIQSITEGRKFADDSATPTAPTTPAEASPAETTPATEAPSTPATPTENPPATPANQGTEKTATDVAAPADGATPAPTQPAPPVEKP